MRQNIFAYSFILRNITIDKVLHVECIKNKKNVLERKPTNNKLPTPIRYYNLNARSEQGNACGFILFY